MSRLNYHHLYYFWQVATHGNLTQVAQSLHVSQSALSSQVKQLEESMGTDLFERRGRKLVLTEAGQRVLGYAQDIFSKGEELESLIRRGIEPEYQHIRIGILSTMSRNFIEGFINPLLQQSSNKVRFSLHARGMANLLDGLSQHEFDLILTNAQVSGPSNDDAPWQSQLIARQSLSIVGAKHIKPVHPFPHGFNQYRWVLPASNSEIRRSFDGFCSVHQFEPDILAEADDMAMMRLLARDSGALAVLPEVVVRDEIKQGILHTVMPLPNIYENFYAITVQRQFRPSLVADLLGQASQLK
ncbi:LysR family transcriptional regulator [Bermanella marisrubri]|uniref:Possible transcriptional activator of LysR family protein n=1 Tax=Bermanella marisrubri TaxID=207949 RepID=Q1N3C9_9GAMM|nr:LysR family transcriptional regulator [Bermanella marisrubri]EAT12662.1 Possible transcriptional activator of LysR family protein [Oceanobacter sp. RED65] [Bermanella marisrubri]QIZ85213.1 LysR family transcriptional regulator [Bermanella marisrubri]